MKPGFYSDMSAAQYHADSLTPQPSLSSSIAKLLLQKTPRHAWLAHPRNPDHKPKDDDKFDLGAVAHELLLGKGGGFVIVQAADWRTRAAQDQRDEARALGKRALLEKDFARAGKMAETVDDRLRAMGIELRGMETELPLFWQDQGVWCRAMLDAIDGTIIYDIKTTDLNLSDEALARQIDTLGYDLSAGHYIRGVERIEPHKAGRLRWRWIWVEANEPHEIRVIEADKATLEIGDRKAATALMKWKRGIETGEWPGWPAEIAMGGLSDWAIQRWIAREDADPDCAIAPFSSQSRTVERPAKEVVWGAG